MEGMMKVKLEAELGVVPAELQQVVTAGELLVGERPYLLKIADKLVGCD